MKQRALLLLVSPLALAAGCLLPSFENVPGDVDAEGGAPTSGATGNTGNEAGVAQAGAPAGGAGNQPTGSEPMPVSDTYVVQQGDSLQVTAGSGVLSNDEPSGLVVSAFDDADADRPAAFDATLTIEADGSLIFEPAAAFFGRYVATYTVENADGESADATVTFVVQPSAVELASVSQGIGGVVLTGGAGDAAGARLAALGDVNDDGFDDFAVAAPLAAGGDGAIYVVFGRAAFGALKLGALAASSTEERYAVLAGSSGVLVGSAVASAGTFNSDQIPDIVVGAPGAAGSDGKLFVVYGGQELRTSLTLATMPDDRGVTISGVVGGQERLGLSASGSGDYNGDEKADLLSGIHPGGVTIGGICAILENPVASSNISGMVHPTFRDSGIFGLPEALTFVGDVNDDGKDDVLTSSRRHVALVFGQGDDSVPVNISMLDGFGELRVRQSSPAGKASVAAAGDVNGDQKADFVYCDQFASDAVCHVFFKTMGFDDTLTNSDWSLSGFAGAPVPPLLGNGSDLNQDGFADLLIADLDAAYVVFGRDAGFGAVDVTSLGSDGFSLAAAAVGALASIASIGDVNGDGYGDFALGEPTAAADSGQIYVVFGGPFGPEQR